jgi:thiol-disulfide isomerase/thioredoxin
MKRIIYISLLGLEFMISCKEKGKGNKIDSDSLSVTDNRQFAERTDLMQIVNLDFDKIQHLADVKNDTVYITNYWATWCPPCVEEIPDFVALQNEYRNKKVKFIFVNVDGEQAQSKVVLFVKENKMKNVYQMPVEELVAKIETIDPQLKDGIPVTIIQKGKDKEGFIGSRPKVFISEKIEKYLNK